MSAGGTSDTPGRGSSPFHTTVWTLVREAGGEGDARRARDELCRRYWRPLYAWARRQGHGPEDAEDLVQAFLLRFIERNDFAVADPDRGRFRSYLVGAFSNFRRDHLAAAQAQKRGGGRRALDFDLQEAEAILADADAEDPARAYDRAWTVALLEAALGRLRNEQVSRGRGEVFDLLKPRLGGDGTAPLDTEALAASGLSTGAVKVAVHRLRKRFGELVREEISRTVEGPEAVEDELRSLL
jgi:RNA polymerase sigma factor (sigma-70 family)